jgi:hypothetical protein
MIDFKLLYYVGKSPATSCTLNRITKGSDRVSKGDFLINLALGDTSLKSNAKFKYCKYFLGRLF